MLFIRDDIISGRCELCQERIRNENSAKEWERAQKTPAEDGKAQNEVDKQSKPRKATRRLKVNEKDGFKVPNRWSLGERSLDKKSFEKSEPSSPPANSASSIIKVENDDGFHKRFIENIMEAAHVKKKQKTEEAGIGSWVAVKSLEEGTDSPASRKEPEAHDKAASGKFTFGKAPSFLW